MIRRNAAQYTKNQESLKQHSFTAMRGVDATKAPTQPDTVLNTMNLDIDYDGGLILRKPLCYCKEYTDITPFNIYYSYDKSLKIIVSDTLKLIDSSSNEVSISKVRVTDILGVQSTYDYDLKISKFLKFSNSKIVNTPTSTIITDVETNLSGLSDYLTVYLYNTTVYTSTVEPIKQSRMLKLFKEDGVLILEILTPEINTLSSDSIAVDFNTTLEYPLAIRDNYNASYTRISGILNYAGDISSNTVSETFSQTYTYEYDIENDFEPVTIVINQYLSFEVSFRKSLTDEKVWVYFTPTSGFGSHYIFEQVEVQTFYNGEYSWRTLYSKSRYKGNIMELKPNSILVSPTRINGNVYEIFFALNVVTSNPADFFENLKLSKITETDELFKISESVKVSPFNISILKAFLDRPVDTTDSDIKFFIKWERSFDGVDWEDAYSMFNKVYNKDLQIVPSIDLYTVYSPQVSTNVLDEKAFYWESKQYHMLDLATQLDADDKSVIYRPDLLILENIPEVLNYVYRCSIIRAKLGSDYDPPEGVSDNDYYCKDLDISSTIFAFKKNSTDFEYNLNNPIFGDMLYWKNSLYSISPEFKNTIYASNPDSAIFPVSRIIDLGTFEGNTVTKLIPWRDYLIAFTENTVHLIKEQEVGFTTKVVNTFIGAPQRDADTCVATLNGIVFKSGSKLYSITPNVNSGDETIFNVSEISKPIEHILDKLSYNDEYKPFAFTTPEAYYLFVPNNVDTFCLKYNYTLRVWTQFKYPVLLYKYEMLSVSDIRVFSRTADGIVEYYFEKEPNDVGELQPYGDFLTTEKDKELGYKSSPIEFFVDSGQKTDNLSLTKQFVESKIIVATLSNKDNFEMDVQIAIEGNTFNKHIDINTDGALVRNASDQILTLGTAFNLTDSADTFNTMRQVFLRYSGRGKTIRHIIKGSSLYKFKIYETFYRFKILNVKQ